MKLRRFSKSVAALMTSMMLACVFPTTSITSLAAELDDSEEKVIELSEDESEAEKKDVTETTTDETTEVVLDFEEDCEDNNIDGPINTNPVDPNRAQSVFDTVMYQVTYGGLSEANTQLGWMIASDYKDYYDTYGIGYFLENACHVKPQVISLDNKMALGGLEARIEENNGHYFLHVKGYYEISVDVWRNKSGNNSLPSNISYVNVTNPYVSVPGSDKFISFGGKIGKDFGNDLGKDGPGVSMGYDGPDGTIPFKWKVNGKNEEDLLIGSICSKKGVSCSNGSHYTYPSGLVVHNELASGRKYRHDELKVKTPEVAFANGESYYGQFDHKFDLGIEYGTRTGKERVNHLAITEILGVPVQMFVYPDSYELFVPNLIEKVGITDVTVSGANKTYTIQLDTNAGDLECGTYWFEIDFGGEKKTLDVGVCKGKESQEIKATVNAKTGGLVRITSVYKGNLYAKDPSLTYNIKQEIPDWRFNIDCDKKFTYTSDNDETSVNFNYKINTKGKYKFLFYYDVDGVIYREYVDVELCNTSGTAKIVLNHVPDNLREMELVNVESPDGLFNYYNNTQVIYRNESLFPEETIPTEFAARVKVKYIEEPKGLTMRHIGATVDYESPTTGPRIVNLEYELNGEVLNTTESFSCREGYHTFDFDSKLAHGSYAQGCITIKKDASYVKLLNIEGPDGESYECNQYLYCDHIYGPGCDADCNRCGAVRTDLTHDNSKDCTKCNNCGEPSGEKHKYHSDCDMVCYECGMSRIAPHYITKENSKCSKCGLILCTEWAENEDGEWFYYKADGSILKNEWAKDGNKWYYLGADGRMETDKWIQYKGSYYYVDFYGTMKTGWNTIDGKCYYLGTDGARRTGWRIIDDKNYYFGTDGILVTGEVTINGRTYQFDNNGVLIKEIVPEKELSGWVEDEDGEWYYVQADGTVLKNGWAKFDGVWNYVGKDGRIVTESWVQYKNDWYYVNVTGDMVTGWAKIGGNQYYLGIDGAMRTGTVAIDGKTYQFASNGVLVKEIVQSDAGNQQSSDKKNGLIEEAEKTYYYVNDVKQLGWKKVDNAWYNFGTNGVMAKNKWVADGKDWFYCGADGKMVTKKWISYKNDWYYFGADGAMVTDKWVSYQNNWYYFNASGIMVTSKWVQYKNDWYYVDADGIMVTGKQVINGKTYNFNSLGVWVN